MEPAGHVGTEGARTMTDGRLLLRADEAGRMLGLGRSKTYELIASGELPSIRVGNMVRVPVQALDEWLAQKTADAITQTRPSS